MKRILSMILALALMLPTFALADDTFKDFTVDELEALAAMIHAELIRRGAEPLTVLQGCYIIGQDIPSGSYRVDAWEGENGYFHIYTDAMNLDYPLMSFALVNYSTLSDEQNSPTIGRVYLGDGMAIVLDVKVTLTPYEGVGVE